MGGGGVSGEGAYSHEVGPLDLTLLRTETTQLQILSHSILPPSPQDMNPACLTLSYHTSLKTGQTSANGIGKSVAEKGKKNNMIEQGYCSYL